MEKLVDLAALRDLGPLVISFNRGPWGDYCGLELHSLARAYPEIFEAGGEVISIGGNAHVTRHNSGHYFDSDPARRHSDLGSQPRLGLWPFGHRRPDPHYSADR